MRFYRRHYYDEVKLVPYSITSAEKGTDPELGSQPADDSINQSINQHELAKAPHIQSSGAPEIQ